MSATRHPRVVERTTAPSEPYTTVSDERRGQPGGRRSTDERAHVRESLTGCRIVELPRITDPRGNLTPIEAGLQVPFEIQRVYYLYDVPGGEARGGHAHRRFEEFIIAASGSFDIVVDDGVHAERFFLNRSYYGLYVPPMVWRELDNFSSGSVCLVLASQRFDEADYIRDYDEFGAGVRG
jgi:WxcM-like, C-terminal